MNTHSVSRKTRPAGEKWVWLASMGLAVGTVMVAALLFVIVRNGLSVFWPKPVLRIELAEGSRFAMRGGTVIGGGQFGVRDKVMQSKGEDGVAKPRIEREWHLMIGNKEQYGASFRYVDLDAAVKVECPRRAIWIERVENGPAIGMPLALRGADGREIKADAPGFDAALRAAVDEVIRLRGELKEIERAEIGRVNHKLTELDRREKRLKSLADPARAAAEREAIDRSRNALREEFKALSAQASDLRKQLLAGTYVHQLFTGESVSFPVGHFMDFHYPNDMSFFAKLGHFLGGMVEFVSTEPREANMEGGIFPAIFGTFVMTLLMSLAVMPFGVLAAIYLREYARQGAFVRMVRICINNLAGVPSIVFGVFGLGFFVYFVGGTVDQLFYSDRLPTPTFGTGGIIWAALTLALMTVPVVIVATEEALAAVPRGVREGSLALGASKWQTISRLVLPAAGPGILTGLVLAMARGAGEVAPLMLVGVVKLAPSLPVDGLAPFVHLDRKFMHLGFHIFDLGFQSPDSEASQPMVFATTLFLILLVVILNLGAIIIRERLRRRYTTGAF